MKRKNEDNHTVFPSRPIGPGLLPRGAICATAALLGCLILLGLIFSPGCASQQPRRDSQFARPHYRVSPGLILNTSQPNPIDPQVFAYRSLWPAAEGDTPLGETTYYREVWHDRQTLWPNQPDYSYRLFRSYRVGTRIR